MSWRRILLCAVSDDDHAPGLVAFAAELAGAGGFDLLVAHVADGRAPVPTRVGSSSASADIALLPHELTHSARLARADGEELLRSLGVRDDESVVAVGEPFHELLRLGRECEAALVVVGTRGRGALRGALVGTVSRKLATEGDRPVVVVRPDAAARRGGASVVCGVAGTLSSALPVARVAADLAARLSVPLTLAHVLDIRDELGSQTDLSFSALLDAEGWAALKVMRGILDELDDGSDARATLRHGHPAEELIALGDETDAALIVVGCRGHRALRTLVEGSVSLKLCRHAPRAVAIVPPRASGAH
jgi:nucleotide-binding universal stress UspA family protein